jgi:hypothetical protein
MGMLFLRRDELMEHLGQDDASPIENIFQNLDKRVSHSAYCMQLELPDSARLITASI